MMSPERMNSLVPSFGFLTNIGAGSGYAAIFRFTGTNTADFRVFEGVNASTGGIGTQVSTTQTFTLGSGAGILGLALIRRRRR